jgi:hypothetical protein
MLLQCIWHTACYLTSLVRQIVVNIHFPDQTGGGRGFTIFGSPRKILESFISCNIQGRLPSVTEAKTHCAQTSWNFKTALGQVKTSCFY